MGILFVPGTGPGVATAMEARETRNLRLVEIGVLEKLRQLPPDERVSALGAAIGLAPPGEREGLVLLLVELASKSVPQKGLRLGAWFGKHRLSHNETAREGAIEVLTRHWRVIPPGLRQVALAAGRGCWEGAFDALEPGDFAACGVSLSQLTLDACDPALTKFLPSILDHGDSRAGAMAGQALLGLALRLTELSDIALLGINQEAPSLKPVLDAEFLPWTPGAVQGLLEAVAVGVASFESHKRKEVLLAALVLLESPRQGVGGVGGVVGGGGRDALADLALDSESPAAQTLRSVFRRARAPLGRQRAWVWLRERAVAAACTERIARAPTRLDHEVLLRLGHLALAPARNRDLAIVPIATKPAPVGQTPPGATPGRRLLADGVVPDQSVLSALSPMARRSVPRLIEALDANTTTRTLALDPFLTDPDPIARFNAARVTMGPTARDYCFDREGTIARHNALRASSAGIRESGRLRVGDGARRRFARGLCRSSHRAVRLIGGAEFDRVTPGGASTLQLLAARRTHTTDPGAFADWVRGIVDSAAPGEVVGTLMVCRRIGAIAAVESILLAIIADSLTETATTETAATDAAKGASRVVATAVACLGELRAPRIVSVLRECMARHPDARVRANAADGLGRLRTVGTGSLSLDEVSIEEHHRVRGSVLRALLTPWPEPKGNGQEVDKTSQAAESLAVMLEDSRPSYRLAGVWVVQRSLRSGLEGVIGQRWDRLASRVRWLADEDFDPSVRARAVVVTNRLDAAMAGLGPRGVGGVGGGGGVGMRGGVML